MCLFEVDPFAWLNITMRMCPFEVDRFACPKTAMRMCPFEVDRFVRPKIAMRMCPFEVDPVACPKTVMRMCPFEMDRLHSLKLPCVLVRTETHRWTETHVTPADDFFLWGVTLLYQKDCSL